MEPKCVGKRIGFVGKGVLFQIGLFATKLKYREMKRFKINSPDTRC